MPIGDFRSKPDNQPRQTVTKDPAPAPPAPPAAEAAPTPEAPEKVEKKELTPGELYLERLKSSDIPLEEAMGIYDAVLTKGYYEEYVRLRGNNRAVLRTRTYEDTLRLQTALEIQKPSMAIVEQEIIAMYNLAASLYEWKGVELKHDNEQDFEKVRELIKKMPVPLFTLLRAELSKFDTKMLLVFSEGAAENF